MRNFIIVESASKNLAKQKHSIHFFRKKNMCHSATFYNNMISIIYVSKTSEPSWSLWQFGLIYKVDCWKDMLFKHPDDPNDTRHKNDFRFFKYNTYYLNIQMIQMIQDKKNDSKFFEYNTTHANWDSKYS
jgi:hypothetical protein